MTRDQVEVIYLLVNVIAKGVLALVVVLVLIATTWSLITNPGWPISLAHLGLDGLVYVVFKHYFPSGGIELSSRDRLSLDEGGPYEIDSPEGMGDGVPLDEE